MFKKNKILKSLASLKITVICLSLLFILTLWGTIDQVEHGLYLAQERFFNSLIFWIGGFCPFPGARFVIWILFINLMAVALTRLVYRWRQAGIILTHAGLLLFFVAAFITFHGVEESQITLREGQSRNVSEAYHDWELSVWLDQGGETKHIQAYASDDFKAGAQLDFQSEGFFIRVDAYYPNSGAYLADDPKSLVLMNPSGIQVIKPLPLEKEPERNIPGGLFSVDGADQKGLRVLLYGGEQVPARITKNGKTYAMMLRRKRNVLPFLLKLKNLRKRFIRTPKPPVITKA